jgi:hypothetical protein
MTTSVFTIPHFPPSVKRTGAEREYRIETPPPLAGGQRGIIAFMGDYRGCCIVKTVTVTFALQERV